MLLELKDIVKKFGEVEVLKGVTFDLLAGEVLGLVGENGAGKSTLMNILSGIHQPTAGEMVLKNEAFAPRTPNDSLDAGIAFIHQELNLFPNLSIFENLFINNFPIRKILGLSFINRKAAVAKAEELLEQVGLEVGVGTLVESLSPAQKQLLEIAKALSSAPQVIIFDEPTTALTRHESSKLFELIHELKGKGIAMIYISHNLEDVILLSDKITVLRDGSLVNSYQKEDAFSLRAIVGDMVGRDMEQLFPPRNAVSVGERLLEVKGMSMPPIINAVSFSACKGEVLGFYGLVGAGRSEVARCIYGLDSFEDGEIR
ncbi:UNVERIFIED_CONTAM: hypothetical protein GTU68_042345, partial [Idotea baltica]|nr:hypothetical protein [Idotea baltica]